MLALVLSLSLAQPVIAGGGCSPGKACRARTFTATTPSTGQIAVQIPNLDFVYFGNSCGIRSNGSNLAVPVGTCNAVLSGGTQALYGGSLWFGNQALTTSFTNPTGLTGAPNLAGDTTTTRLWRTRGGMWSEVGVANADVKEGTRYVYASDRAASFDPAWLVAPRVSGASAAFTTVGTRTSGTTSWGEPFTSWTTTAIVGNQAHHSTGAIFTPNSRWSARVGFGTLGSFVTTRAFFGLSATLPLLAGSSTPTADAAVFRADTSIDGLWYACTSDGTVALSCTSTGVAVAFATDISQTLEIDCREGTATGPSACTFWIDGVAVARRTASLPNATLGSTISVETLAAVAHVVFMGAAVSIEQVFRATP